MNAAFEEMYNDFLDDISEGRLPGLTEKERVEQIFWRAKKYWETLKIFIRKEKFENDLEEIEFFKNVKPAFTCQIEYSVLLSHALISVPATGLAEITNRVLDFWKEEDKRCDRFFEKNKLFIEYYESGGESLDEAYYLRRNNTIDVSTVSLAPVYEEDNEFCTYADPLLRSYLAHKKYHSYVINQLLALQTSETI